MGLGYAAAQGWIPLAIVNDLVTVLIFVGAAGYGVYTTKLSVVAARAAEALPKGTQIVTSAEIAAATPNNPNVVSSDLVKVVPFEGDY